MNILHILPVVSTSNIKKFSVSRNKIKSIISMDHHHQQSTSTLDLIKNEIQKFQRLGKNSSCVESSSLSCAGIILAENVPPLFPKFLMQILENTEKIESRRSPEENAMSNSLVVRKILNYLDARSLLELREVSRLWREEATSLLLSKRHEKFLCVKFKETTQGVNYRHDNGETLEDFLEECAQNPEMCIYSGFIFEGRFFQYDPNLTRLFSDFGSQIQHLNLSVEYLDVASVRKILLEWTPNLKSLILDPKDWRDGTEPKNDQKSNKQCLSLPKLRKLTLPKIMSTYASSSVDLMYEILTCAPNLTSVEDPNLAHVTQIISAGKLSLVKSLTWSFLGSTEQNVTNLVRFLAAGPKLTSLTLQDFRHPLDSRPDARILPAIFSLLELGQNTLEKVTGVQMLGQYSDLTSGLQILPLLSLTELLVSADGFPSQTILPRGHDLFKICPNLKSLHLKSTNKEVYPFNSLQNAHKSLQKLDISISAFKLRSQHVREWVDQLGVHYPNITSLHINIRYNVEENIPELLSSIPRYFKQLEQLFITTRIFKKPCDGLKMNLDPALTGFSRDVCKTLENAEFPELELFDQIRRAPSILDLKKLTSLTFEVQFELKGKLQPLWTHVSELYTFKPMSTRQGLEVKVRGFYSKRIPLTASDLGPL